MTQDRDYVRPLAQAWTSMFVVFVANLCMELARSGAMNDPAYLGQHLGIGGVKLVLAVMSVYASVPMLVHLVSARWFRWVVVALSVLATLFVLTHEFSHLKTDRPFGVLHVLELVHHLLGICATVMAVKWARQGREAQVASQTAAVAGEPA